MIALLGDVGACLPPMLAFQVLVLIVLKRGKTTLPQETALLLYSVVILCILSITGITPLSGFHADIRWEDVNLIPFRGIRQMLQRGFWGFVLNVPGNIVLFMPFGLLLPLIWDKNGMIRTTLHGAAFSLMIECSQLFLSRGPDIDDWILNTTGTLLGYLAYRLFRYIAPRNAERVAVERGGVWLPWAYIAIGMCSMAVLGVVRMRQYGMV